MAETNPPASGPFTAEGSPTLQQLVDYFVERLYHPENMTRLQATQTDASARALVIADAVLDKAKSVVGWDERRGAIENIIRIAISLTDVPESILDPLTRGAIESLLGEGGGARHVGDTAGSRLLQKLAGSATSVEPGLDGAARYMTLFLNESVEALLRSVMLEVVTEFGPEVFGVGGGIENLQKLQEVIEHALGGDRMVRRVLQPIIAATAITPAQWYANKKYRPELLSPNETIRQWMRGRMSIEERDEELARQGWSPSRIDAFVNGARKFLSDSDVEFLVKSDTWGEDVAAQYWADQGVPDNERALRLVLVKAQAERTANLQLAELAVASYAAGELGDVELDRYLKQPFLSLADVNQLRTRAAVRRRFNIRRITSTRVRQMVLDGIAAVPDYRRALEREGYPPEDVVLEELALRLDLKQKHDLQQKDPTIAQLEAAVLAGVLSLDDFIRAPSLQALTEQGRAVTVAVLQARIEKQAADAQEKANREAERAAREAEIEAKRARAFPSLQEYRRGYVRGFIGREVYAAALAREKILGDDAGFLLTTADDEREQFLADEEVRQQKLAEGEHRNLSIAELEQAVLAGELEVSAFDSYLAKVHYADDDRRLLVRLVRDKLEDQAAAKAKRDAAEKLAAAKQVSLADWERAVRLEVRTIAQYAGFLERLGLDAPSRSLILDVLGAQLTADREARAKREAREAEAQQQGIALAQRRRVVIAGVRPKQYYADALVAAKWPADDQLADLDLLDVEIAAAAEARRRRGEIIEKTPASLVSIAQLEHALVLGLLTPAEFRAALLDRGASDADADLLVTLALAKVADARAAATLHDQVQRELEAKGVSLAELEAAVRRGIVTLDDFALDLSNRGLAGEQVLLLRQLLEERVGVDVDELRAKIVAALTKAGADFTLDELDAALAASEIDAPTFQAALEGNGAPRDAALVYTRLQAA